MILGRNVYDIYKNTSDVVDELQDRLRKFKRSLETIVLGNKRMKNKKIVLKLSIGVMENNGILKFVNEKLHGKEPNLFRVKNISENFHSSIVYDMCLSPKSQIPQDLTLLLTQLRTTKNEICYQLVESRKDILEWIQFYRDNYKDEQNDKMLNEKKEREELLVGIPKYCRVNTHKSSLSQVKKYVEQQGVKYDIDKLIPDLLVIQKSEKVEFHKWKFVKNGNVVIQDKGSCLPVFALMSVVKLFFCKRELVYDRFRVVDATAAPGNKTSYICNFFPNNSNQKMVYAFERDGKRFNLLKNNLIKQGIENASIFHKDFLKVDGKDKMFQKVKAILLDPSCSGSGIIRRNVFQKEEEMFSKERIRTLSNFQSVILQHALSSFPQVQIVVYSTCSKFEMENEGVIRDALSKNKDFEVFNFLPEWKERGKGDDNVGLFSIRTSPQQSQTNGFFMCCLIRKTLKSKPNEKKRGRDSSDTDSHDLEEDRTFKKMKM